MKILETLEQVRKAVLHDSLVGGSLPRDLQLAAINAINSGPGSEAWNSYMSIFADNEAQLKRLTAQDATGNQEWLMQTSAYLVSNGVCTSASTLHFVSRIDQRIDDDLDSTPDAEFISTRKFMKIRAPHSAPEPHA